jgi:hypothetical protein
MKKIKTLALILLTILSINANSQCGPCVSLPQVQFSFPKRTSPVLPAGTTINVLTTDLNAINELIVFSSPHTNNVLHTGTWQTTIEIYCNGARFDNYSNTQLLQNIGRTFNSYMMLRPGANNIEVKAICPNAPNSAPCTIGTFTINVNQPSANITITRNCCPNTTRTIRFFMTGSTNIPGLKIKVMEPGSTTPKYFTFQANTNTTCFTANGNYAISLVDANNNSITPAGWSNISINKSKLDCPSFDKPTDTPPNKE